MPETEDVENERPSFDALLKEVCADTVREDGEQDDAFLLRLGERAKGQKDAWRKDLGAENACRLAQVATLAKDRPAKATGKDGAVASRTSWYAERATALGILPQDLAKAFAAHDALVGLTKQQKVHGELFLDVMRRPLREVPKSCRAVQQGKRPEEKPDRAARPTTSKRSPANPALDRALRAVKKLASLGDDAGLREVADAVAGLQGASVAGAAVSGTSTPASPRSRRGTSRGARSTVAPAGAGAEDDAPILAMFGEQKPDAASDSTGGAPA